MALPSSSSTGLRVFPGELPFTRVATNPLEMEEAAASGRKFTQDLLDDGIVRPKKRAAEAAEFELKKTQAVADQGLVKTLTDEKRTGAEARTNQNEIDTILRAVQKTVLGNPVFQKSLAQNYVNEQYSKTNESGTRVKLTEGALQNAPTVVDTVTANVNTDNNKAAVAEANSYVDARVNTTPYALDQKGAQIENNNTTATGQAKIAAVPFEPKILEANIQGVQAKTVDDAFKQKINLANTQAGAVTGPKLPPPSPEVVKERAEKAKEASEQMGKLRDGASLAESKLQKFDAFRMLVGTDVSTGYLHGTKLGVVYNGILAQMGNRDSAIRTQMAALQAQMVPDMARGLGQMSDNDVTLFMSASQGPDKTPQVNAALLTASVSAAQRTLDKRDFYSEIIGRSSVELADDAWSSYIKSNPIFDSDSSSAALLVLNQHSLSPEQYSAAIQSPEETATRIMPTGDAVNKLPLGNTEAQLNALPPTVPFAAMTLGNTTRVITNPKYWLEIAKLHKRLNAGNAGGVDSSARDIYQESLTQTPVEQAGQSILIKAAPRILTQPDPDIKRFGN